MSDDSTAAADRRRLIRSIDEWSTLDEVAEAISAASEARRTIYAERLDQGYRWSLAQQGGAYPLLRTAARFLRTDYTKIGTGFPHARRRDVDRLRTPEVSANPDRWTLITFEVPTPIDELKARQIDELA